MDEYKIYTWDNDNHYIFVLATSLENAIKQVENFLGDYSVEEYGEVEIEPISPHIIVI